VTLSPIRHVAAAFLLLFGVSCQSQDTYAVVTFQSSTTPIVGLTQIDLQLNLAGRIVTTSVGNHGAPITLPASAALRIRTGSGHLVVQAVARDATGAAIDGGSGVGEIKRGSKTAISVQFGQISLDQLALDYGTVSIGAAKSQTVTLTNHGNAASSAINSIVSGDYATANDTCNRQTIPSGGKCTLDVIFTPTAAGARDGTLTLQIGSQTLTVALSGIGDDSVTLTVNFTGSGSGTVTTGVSGLVCTTTSCAITFSHSGAAPSVTFTPQPDYKSTVSGWSGACSGNGTCTLTTATSQTVTLAFDARPPSLTVRVSGTGTVVSADGKISCGNGATACGPILYSTPNQVTLTTSASAPNQFVGWGGGASTCPTPGGCAPQPCYGVACSPGQYCESGKCVPTNPLCSNVTCPASTACEKGTCVGYAVGCSGTMPSCTMQVPADLVITATFASAPNYVFTTAAPVSLLSPGGLAGADAACTNAAQSAGLAGTYAAWLSTDTAAATSRVGAGGWYRTDGRVFAASLANLTSAKREVFYPLRFDPWGNDLGPVALPVATGTSADFMTGVANDCENYSVANAEVRTGSTTGGSGLWTDTAEAQCDVMERLFCFRSDGTTVQLVLPALQSRRAFVTKGAFDPSKGLGAADELCSVEATSAGLTSATGFLAFIATPDASAASRFDLTAGTATYARLDGAVIVGAAL
jgi:hypothetical protein